MAVMVLMVMVLKRVVLKMNLKVVLMVVVLCKGTLLPSLPLSYVEERSVGIGSGGVVERQAQLFATGQHLKFQ